MTERFQNAMRPFRFHGSLSFMTYWPPKIRPAYTITATIGTFGLLSKYRPRSIKVLYGTVTISYGDEDENGYLRHHDAFGHPFADAIYLCVPPGFERAMEDRPPPFFRNQ